MPGQHFFPSGVLQLAIVSAVVQAAVDKKPVNDCRSWAIVGQCRDNAKFMSKNCAASCQWYLDSENSTQVISQLRSRLSFFELRISQLIGEVHNLKTLTDSVRCKPNPEISRVAEIQDEQAQLKTELQGSRATSKVLQSRIADLETQLSGKGVLPELQDKMILRIAELEASQKQLKFDLESVRASESVQVERPETAERAAANDTQKLVVQVADLEEQLFQKRYEATLAAGKFASLEKKCKVNMASMETPSARSVMLEAEVEHLRKIANSTRAAEILASNQSDSFAARVLELEAQLLERSAFEKEHESSGQSAWNAVYENLRNLPSTLKQWIRHLPKNIAESSVYSYKLVIDGSIEATIYAKQLALESYDVLTIMAQNAPENATQAKIALGKSLEDNRIKAQELITQTRSQLKESYEQSSAKVLVWIAAAKSHAKERWDEMSLWTRAWAARTASELRRSRDQLIEQLLVQVSAWAAPAKIHIKVVLADSRFKAVVACLFFVVSILWLRWLRSYLAAALLRAAIVPKLHPNGKDSKVRSTPAGNYNF